MPSSQWATQAAIVPSAGNIPQITLVGSVSDWTFSVALQREITDESEESVCRHSCRWMLQSSVRRCSERRARSGGPEDHKIHGDFEGHDCEIGSAEARR